jgi:hypothetical protein
MEIFQSAKKKKMKGAAPMAGENEFEKWWSNEFSKDKRCCELFIMNPLIAVKYAASKAWEACGEMIMKEIENFKP